MRIYTASSWRNERYPAVVKALLEAGHEVYDFQHPDGQDEPSCGFHWSNIDPQWEDWSPGMFRLALSHPTAIEGFNKDLYGLDWADACVLIMPCGRSAHLELGYAVGKGKFTIILLDEGDEPELMYLFASSICLTVDEMLEELGEA